jgi:inner membrane protein
MSSPIACSLAGYAVNNFFVTANKRERLSLILLSIFMANAADLDFLPGLLVGNPPLYHRGITHSLVFAFIFSIGIAGAYSIIRKKPFFAIFSLCFISYLTHLIIDFFAPYDSHYEPVHGLLLFWPISGERCISPVPVFLGIYHNASSSPTTLRWIESILTLPNLTAIVREIILIMPFVFLGYLYRSRYKRNQLSQEGPVKRKY